MVEAADFQVLSSSLWLWQAYDPAVRSDLFSTLLMVAGRLFLIDPIPLAETVLAGLAQKGVVTGVIVTNANHTRAAQAFAIRFNVPIFASAAAVAQLGGAETITIEPQDKIQPGLATIAIEGAAPGEIALHFENDGGTIIVGDALINFEPLGFALLPAKYCSDQRLMRKSLRQLLELPFERLLFAHGIPILSAARARLATLLAG